MSARPGTLLALTLAALAAGCAGGGQDGSPPRTALAATRAAGPPDRRAFIRDRHLPNVPLITHDGRTVRFYDDLVRDRVVAINFMFATCRAACPSATKNLVEVQRALRDRAGGAVTFLSISLTPERDSPAVLRAYAEAHAAGPGWYFLTGNPDDVEMLRHRLGAYDRDPVVDADKSQHAGLVILGNEPRARWTAISALSKPVRIRQAIERVLLPAREWPTGAAVVNEGPYEESEASKQLISPPDLASLPALD